MPTTVILKKTEIRIYSACDPNVEAGFNLIQEKVIKSGKVLCRRLARTFHFSNMEEE